MSEFFLNHYSYWFVLILLVIGLYGMLIKGNLMKKVIGLTIFQNAIILLFIVGAHKWGGTVPIKDARWPVEEVHQYINPLPHTLMLTAIVVGVATVGVALALLIAIYRNYGTLEEPRLMERVRRDRE